MKLYFLELKRILKTRTTWIILASLLAISLLFGYLPVTYVHYTDVGPNGEEIAISGLDALELRREAQSLYAGEVTPEKLTEVLATYQSVISEYGDYYSNDFPLGVYRDSITPISPFLHLLRESYADPHTGHAADLMTLSAADINDIYPQMSKHLDDLMRLEQGDYPSIQAKAGAMYEQVNTPLTFVPGFNPDAMDYVTFCLLFLLLGMAVLCAPTFAAEYQTQADDILRITRHGQTRLALTKLAAALTILVTTFALCMIILCGVSDALFGRECLATSIQVQYTTAALVDLDLGGMRTYIIWAGLATLLATASCTLYLSTKCRTTASSIIWALILCLLPIIIHYIFDGTIADWVRCLLPASGIGLTSSFQYALIDTEFLRLGATGFWSPMVILLAAIIEIPLFLALSVRSYCRHSA